MIDTAERDGKDQARHDDRGADEREHRHRPRDGRRGEGLQAHPDDARDMSLERRDLLARYGAKLVLTPGDRGHAGGDRQGAGAARATRGTSCRSSSRTRRTRRSTARRQREEIWDDTDGTSTLRRRRRHRRHDHRRRRGAKGAAAQRAGDCSGAGALRGSVRAARRDHPIQGIGAGFIPRVLELDLVDEIITVGNEDALNLARRLAREEGLLVGISAGAAVVAALQVARRPENAGKLVVVILPDFGERYLSTPLFADLAD